MRDYFSYAFKERFCLLRRFFAILLFTVQMAASAQLNTNQVMLIGRNALYYDDYVLSIQYFSQVIGAKPYLWEPYYYRAIAKYYLDDYRGAVEDCSRAIERNPYIVDIYRLQGLNYIKVDSLKLAVGAYDKAIALEPNDQQSWYNRTLCRLQLKENRQALLDLDTVNVRWPSYMPGYEMKAALFLQLKDTLSADSLIDKAMGISDRNDRLWAMKASIRLQRGQYAIADTLLTHAIALQPRETGYYLNRAIANYYLRKLRNAMNDYDEALKLSPDNFFAHYNRALLRAQVGEDNAAIEDFDFVLSREPDNLMAVYNRALLREKTGDYRGAVVDYTRVLKDYPRFWAGLAARMRCYRRLGNTAAALRDERALTVAQLDDMFGSSARRPKAQTRKRNDKNLENYAQLVVDDEADSTLVPQYASELRGRIQNRKADETPLPLFSISMQGSAASTQATSGGYLALLGEWRQSARLPQHFYLSAGCPHNQDNDYTVLFKQIADIEKERQQTTRVADPLSAGILYAVSGDYATALPLLDTAIAQGGRFVALALIERADVRLHMSSWTRSTNEVPLQKEASVPVLMASLNDLQQAGKLLPECAYIYYNMANLYVALKQNEKAELAYNHALLLDARMGEAWYNRALLRLSQGKTEDALRDLSRAGELGIFAAYSVMKQHRK